MFSPQPFKALADTLVAVESRMLLRLLEAYQAAHHAGLDVWQFAVQLSALRAEAISDSTVRVLVARGWVAHARETTRSTARRRSMRQLAHLGFSERSCFVLTELGLELLRQRTFPGEAQQQTGPGLSCQADPPSSAHPCFLHCDDGRRELRWARAVVKRFVARAKNQELLLASFEEQGWARRIQDPIPPRHGLDSKRRLRDTITRLNRAQLVPLIRFHGDGTGQGITWEALQETTNRPPTARL